MKILLTGATGFIGRNILDFLGNHEVFCLVRNSEKYARVRRKNTTPIYCDIREEIPSLPDVSVIIHNAGLIRGAKKEYYEVNTGGTYRLLEKARAVNGLKKFIYVSSQAAAGPAEGETPKKATDEENPISDYGRSKLLAEKKVKESGLPYLILRPSAVYGPGDRDIFTVFKMVKNGLVFIPAGVRYANFINVLDVCGGILRAAETSLVNRTFFLLHPEVLSFEDFARAVALKMRKKINIVKVPVPVVYGAGFLFSAAAFFSGKPALLNIQKIREITAKLWIADPEGMLSELGYKPLYDISSGVSLTLDWYRKKGWL